MKQSTKKLIQIGRGMGRLDEITELCDKIVGLFDNPEMTKGDLYFLLRKRRDELIETSPTMNDIVKVEKDEQNTLF